MNRVFVQGAVVGPDVPRRSRRGTLYWVGGIVYRRARLHYIPVTGFGRVAEWLARFAGTAVAVEGALEEADRGDYRTLAVIAEDLFPLDLPTFKTKNGWPAADGTAEADLSGWVALPPKVVPGATLLRLKIKVPRGREWRTSFATAVVHGEEQTGLEPGTPVFVRGTLQSRIKKRGVDLHVLEHALTVGHDRNRSEEEAFEEVEVA